MTVNLSAPKDAVSALRFCRCAEKAANMKAEGYTVAPLMDIEGAVFVHKPADEFGHPVGGYAVDLVNTTCTCPDFAKHGSVCKHILFAAEEHNAEDRAKWNAICAEVEALAA